MGGEHLSDKRILLVIGGGIAAYKALELIRRLRERGATVRAVMTSAAKEFITPLSVASLTGQRVSEGLFSLTDEAEMGHIELSRDADLIVVAPATAHLMARMASGLADDLASTLLLATDKRSLIAPAMNLRMWLHPATQRNLATLVGDGVLVVGPNEGSMACGEFGPGRMAEPLDIVASIETALKGDTSLPLPLAPAAIRPSTREPSLSGRRVVVTSGPTHEPIDPIRYLANRSSGRQGHAIAQMAAAAGADVTLVSGPVALPDPPGVKTVRVETAREMLNAVEQALPADLFIATAAVADWRPSEVATGKLKKGGSGPPTIPLTENPDILAMVGQRLADRPALVVGFAAETDHLLDHAAGKLDRKGCDMIVANDVGAAGGVMGGEANTVHIITRQGVESWPTLPKNEVARRLIARCAEQLAGLPT